MGLKKQIMFSILAAVSFILLQPYIALAQKLDSNAVVAADAYTFAKDIAKVNQNDPAFKALENASRQQEEGETKDTSSGNYVQCGSQICNLDTQYCYRETNSWYTGQGGSVTRCVCSNAELPLQVQQNATRTVRTLMTTNCSEVVNQKAQVDNEVISMTGSDGKKYQVHIGDTISVRYANESNKATSGCEVLPVKLYNYRKCFFCPLMGVIYDGSAKITDVAFSKMAAAFATLLAIGFAIWVALQVLTQVSSLTKQDAPKFLGGLIKQSYKVIIAFILLQNSQQIFTYAIRPVLEAGLVFGQNMLTTQDIFDGLDWDEDGKYIRQAKAVTGGTHYEVGTYDKLEQFVVAVQREIAFMQAVGTSLVCTGTNLMLLKGNVAEFGDGFQMFIQGVILAFFGFLLSLAFVFYLIDGIVQIGVVGALLPFLIAAWPFKATSKYTSTGVQMLLNSAFLFLFIGFVVSANIFLVNEALNQTADEQQSELLTLCSQEDYFVKNKTLCEEALNETPRMGALFEIAQTLNSLDSSRLKQLTDISSIGFLILLFCCLFGFKFTNQAGSLADKFASGTISKPIAPGIATMGASFAKSAALRATEDIREAAGDRLERGAKAVVGLVPRGINKAWRKIRGKDKAPVSGNSVMPQKFENSRGQDQDENIGASARQGVTFNEKGKNAQTTPTLSEKEPQNKNTPTLSEAGGEGLSPRTQISQDSQGSSEEDAKAPQSPQNEDTSAMENNAENPQQSDASQKAEKTSRISEPEQSEQTKNSRTASAKRRQPRRSTNKTQPSIRRQPRGGSGYNRTHNTKRLRGKTNG